ncbi:tyrosine-type recombinase/integrase [Sinorhizobium meliloti]|uniref:tyrosine-type recombinase/integrase n=1 Tax=Rhizobium meliloti TaxID=382 RepID=UPI003D64B45B
MAVKERGRGWQVDVTLDKRYRPFFETKAEAETWEADARHAHKMGRAIPEAATVITQGGGRIENVRDLLDMVKDDWKLGGAKDISKAYRNGEMFLEWFGEKRHPEDVTDITVDDYVRHLRKIGNSGSTVNRKLSVVRMILKKARKRKMIADLPEIPLFEEASGSLNWLDFGQEDPVLSHLLHRKREDLYDLVIFLLDTGSRINEALRLEWRTIRPTVVVLENRKNGNMMGLPLTKRAQAALQRRRSASTDPKGPFGDIEYDQARTVLKSIYTKLEGDYAAITQPFHVYRHSCASRLATRGVDAKRIKEWMDHASFTTTERYMKLAPSALELAASALEPEGLHPALKVVT